MPATLGEVGVSLVAMVNRLEDYAGHEQTGDHVSDDIMWDFVCKAAEQAIADVKVLAAKLKYDIF